MTNFISNVYRQFVRKLAYINIFLLWKDVSQGHHYTVHYFVFLMSKFKYMFLIFYKRKITAGNFLDHVIFAVFRSKFDQF
jgi:hypothetical protein